MLSIMRLIKLSKKKTSKSDPCWCFSPIISPLVISAVDFVHTHVDSE